MIVYVESNFFLEIALNQEEAPIASDILALAQGGKIELAFPSFALSEPFTTLMNRHGKRTSLYNSLRTTLRDIKRSEPMKQTALGIETLLNTLVASNENEVDLLHSVVEQILAVGRVIETDIFSLREAMSYQKILDLAPQDSIIYATIVADLKKRSQEELKCFLSRDKKAFSAEDDSTANVAKERNKKKMEARERIKNELNTYECKYFSSFDSGASYIRRFA